MNNKEINMPKENRLNIKVLIITVISVLLVSAVVFGVFQTVKLNKAVETSKGFETERNTLSNELSEEKSNNEALQNELIQKDTIIKNKDEEIEVKQSEIEKKSQEIASKAQELTEKTQTLAERTAELENKSKELAAKDKELTNINKKLTDKQAELKRAQAGIDKLKNINTLFESFVSNSLKANDSLDEYFNAIESGNYDKMVQKENEYNSYMNKAAEAFDKLETLLDEFKKGKY